MTCELLTHEARQFHVQRVLANWHEHEWTVQGFGMMRTYLDADKRWRLNVWDDRLAVRNVSIIHDHPWSFRSWIFSGLLVNQRYYVVSNLFPPFTHEWHTIETGESGGPRSEPKKIVLGMSPAEHYGRGATYEQRAEEIHATFTARGTVTLNDRSAPSEAHTARVFWPLGNRWVDAKPRLATTLEIEETLRSIDMSQLRAAG